jgi:hypothetical protein
MLSPSRRHPLAGVLFLVVGVGEDPWGYRHVVVLDPARGSRYCYAPGDVEVVARRVV